MMLIYRQYDRANSLLKKYKEKEKENWPTIYKEIKRNLIIGGLLNDRNKKCSLISNLQQKEKTRRSSNNLQQKEMTRRPLSNI